MSVLCSKTSVDWFYGFKLHLIINDEGELVRGGATPHLTPLNHSPFEKLLLQKRALIETVIGQLKMIYELEHSRHRCLTGLIIHLLGVLITYSWQSLKPSLRLRKSSASSLSSNLYSS